LLYIIAIIVMITITRIKDIDIQNIKIRKYNQIDKFTIIEHRIHLLYQINFSLIEFTTFFWIRNLMKILQAFLGSLPPSSPPLLSISFRSNHKRLGGRNRVYGY
jgi:hypothetical protein